MGAVAQFRAAGETVTVGGAVGAYLASIDRPESRGTHGQYPATLRQFRDRFGQDAELAGLGAVGVRALIEETWGQRKPSTCNRSIDVFRSAYAYWTRQGWAAQDPTEPMRRRTVAADRSRALSRAGVEQLLTREDIGLRERVLWRMLYESAARGRGPRAEHRGPGPAQPARASDPKGRRRGRDRVAVRHCPPAAEADQGP
jgi:integrase/recombinase XerC/integrase/recombinase XerD